MKKNPNVEMKRRLALIQGQVEGVGKMIDDNRGCLEIVQQITAVRSALAKVGIGILKNESISCVKGKDSEKLEDILRSFYKLA